MLDNVIPIILRHKGWSGKLKKVFMHLTEAFLCAFIYAWVRILISSQVHTQNLFCCLSPSPPDTTYMALCMAMLKIDACNGFSSPSVVIASE